MRTLILASAALLLVQAGAVAAQQKPVPRTDFVKSLDTKFASTDTNHDGFISKAELAAEQQRELGQATARLRQELETKFTQLDTNKDRQLSLQEFLAATPALSTAVSTDQMIQRLDSNHDGKISADEFRAPRLAEFAKADTNHDNVLSPAELKAAAGRK